MVYWKRLFDTNKNKTFGMAHYYNRPRCILKKIIKLTHIRQFSYGIPICTIHLWPI